MYAPVDSCNSDPTCSPGCGAEVALVAESTVVDDLSLLRDFKDDVLAASAIGQEWANLYEANRVDLAVILAADSQLRAQARSVIGLWLPLIEAVVNPDIAEDRILTTMHLESAKGLVASLLAKENQALNPSLEYANELLDAGQQYVGMDIRTAWAIFQTAAYDR